MPITSTAQPIGVMPSDIRISRMLRQVDAGLAVAKETAEAAAADATSVDVIQGLAVSLGTFPEVLVAAGSLLTPAGAVHTYEAGVLEVDTESQGDTTVYVFINFDYAIELADELPLNARYALARVTLDETGTDFDSLRSYGTSVVINEVNENGDLAVVGLYTGPVCLERTDYAYDVDGQPLATTMQSTYKSFQLDYVVNGSGEITDRKETHFLRQQVWLNGGVVLDGSEELSGVGWTQVFFPHRYLIADGSEYASGAEFATGEY